MNYRPWPIKILALLHVLAPIGNFLISAWISQMTLQQYASTFVTPFDVFTFWLLLPLAGIAIYICRPWSFSVFLFAMGWCFFTNYQAYEFRPDLFPIWGMVFFYGLNLLVVSYFFIPAVRVVYINRRIRWWEAKPRYFVPIAATLGGKPATIENISSRGSLMHGTEKLMGGDISEFSFEHLGHSVKGKGEIVRVADGTTPGKWEYGVEFVQLDAVSRHAMKKLIAQLEKTGVMRRPERVKTLRDFFRWFKEVVQTGRGLVPDVPDQFKKKSD